MTANETLTEVLAILQKDCESPCQKIRQHGEVLIKISNVLEGKTTAESIAIMRAAATMVSVIPMPETK